MNKRRINNGRPTAEDNEPYGLDEATELISLYYKCYTQMVD